MKPAKPSNHHESPFKLKIIMKKVDEPCNHHESPLNLTFIMKPAELYNHHESLVGLSATC
jgi:hypothetical protein